jgi:hypothetical protein
MRDVALGDIETPAPREDGEEQGRRERIFRDQFACLQPGGSVEDFERHVRVA